MRTLFIDIETYSSVDIMSCGAYKYTESPDFEILIVGYAINDSPVRVIDVLSSRLLGLSYEEALPKDFLDAFYDPETRVVAHNAVFERLSFSRIGMNIPLERWYCTAVKAAYCGLPLSLDGVSKALDLQDKKLDTGKALIKYFSCPCKPTKVNRGRTRNYPEHAPEKWDLYMEYNEYDVRAEREIYKLLEQYEIPQIERELYVVDQTINDNGIFIDQDLAQAAIQVDIDCTEHLIQDAKALTGLANPNSAAQIKDWISRQTGTPVNSLAKGEIDDLFDSFADYPDVIELLNIRKQLSKTSIKKYYAMSNCACSDGRVRGTFQFYGANRTGRWAGRLLQLQNLSKNHLDNLEQAREALRTRDWELLSYMYGDVPDLLSQLVRTGLIAPEGYTFSVADFSAIEARVISWLAGEEWRMNVFRGDGKIYEATGSRMFGVPISAITKGSELRQKSKISELALGYEGGNGALARMGGEKMGLSDSEMASLVKNWRNANPAIVDMWAELNQAALDTVRTHRPVVATPQQLLFECSDDYMTIKLPSGRKLFYYKPYIKSKYIGKSTRQAPSVYYQGTIQATKQWGYLDTYGGKLTENIVQAIARDLLAYTMINLTNAGYKIVMHVHDEVIAEIPKDSNEQQTYDKMVDIMKTPPAWAQDLPLNADGYITDFYKKD